MNYGPIIPMVASRRVKTEKSTSSSIKYEGYAHCSSLLLLFFFSSSIAMAYCIMNFSYLFADCAKQFVRNAQNCRKPKTKPDHTSMLVRMLLAKYKTVIMPQPSYLLDWRHRWKWSFCCDWGDKRKFERRAVGDTKKALFRRVSRIGKNAGVWRGQDK